MNVTPITPTGVQAPAVAKGAVHVPEENFGNLVARQLQHINQHQLEADAAIQQLATGQTDDVQNVVLSMAKADLSFRLVLEIRNRLIESYQEIMRMQV